jgi:hypothetical protein
MLFSLKYFYFLPIFFLFFYFFIFIYCLYCALKWVTTDRMNVAYMVRVKTLWFGTIHAGHEITIHSWTIYYTLLWIFPFPYIHRSRTKVTTYKLCNWWPNKQVKLVTEKLKQMPLIAGIKAFRSLSFSWHTN